MKTYKDVSVILPSLNPDEKLVGVVEGLIDAGFEDIILVDDGSAEEHKKYFDSANKYDKCTVLQHDVNKGKGRALKTAFEYYINNRKGAGVVTADGDGQHLAEDIKKCAEKMVNENKVVLGVRDFSRPDVPPRSRLGNRITSFMFLTSCRLKISDTQTGLRAIPAEYLSVFLSTVGERYEFETNMLLDFSKHNVPFMETQIQTVYIDENATSHFDPIKDSIRIYKQILKYIFSSIGSFVIDNLLFFLLFLFLGSIKNATIVCTVISRILSSICNYAFNKKLVFGNKSSTFKTLVKYYSLCVPQMLVSALALTLFAGLLGVKSAGLTTVIKIIVDTFLFICSYIIQKKWVFKNDN